MTGVRVGLRDEEVGEQRSKGARERYESNYPGIIWSKSLSLINTSVNETESLKKSLPNSFTQKSPRNFNPLLRVGGQMINLVALITNSFWRKQKGISLEMNETESGKFFLLK